MTIEEAISTARAIQTDLDAGRLPVPYPASVCKQIMRCCGVFVAHATDTKTALALVARLNATETKEGELPW